RLLPDVACAPRRSAIVDSACLSRGERRGNDDAIAERYALFHFAAAASNALVHAPAKRDHRDEGKGGAREPFGPFRQWNARPTEQSDERGGNAQEHDIELRVDEEHLRC